MVNGWGLGVGVLDLAMTVRIMRAKVEWTDDGAKRESHPGGKTEGREWGVRSQACGFIGLALLSSLHCHSSFVPLRPPLPPLTVLSSPFIATLRCALLQFSQGKRCPPSRPVRGLD